ncbi:tyrosine-protein phosphatase [Nocardioides insulae]|uniref:tyrosine-protein phosphatase n=1 Tax=Nocardioides insulae TaxID=394734 RepID=UPI00040901AD|nr:tyrosine-protein phosphatase [Nocardioides insulae]
MTVLSHDPRFNALRNFRDVGGLRTGDGRQVRTGILYRSGTVAFVDAGVAAELAKLGIRSRIDLRSQAEMDETLTPDLDAALNRVAIGITAGGVWEAQVDVEHPSESVAAHYARYLLNSGESLRAIVDLLLDELSGGYLVHCTAGKDRTGVVFAMVLSAIGVLDEEIVADYAATQADLEELLAQLRTLPAYGHRVQELPAESRTADPRSMELFLAGLESEYGSARAYLVSHGVTEAQLDQLADRLLVAAD